MIWDLATGLKVGELTGHIGWATTIAITFSGRHAVTGSRDKSVRLWHLATRKEVGILQGHRDWVTTVAVTPDCQYIVSGSRDCTLRLWNPKTMKTIAIFNADSAIVTCSVLQMRNEGRLASYVIAGDEFGLVHFLQLENLTSGPSLVTAWKQPKIAAGCPFCHTWPDLPETALGKEWRCPSCNVQLWMNPFLIDADWRSVAIEWQRGDR